MFARTIKNSKDQFLEKLVKPLDVSIKSLCTEEEEEENRFEVFVTLFPFLESMTCSTPKDYYTDLIRVKKNNPEWSRLKKIKFSVKGWQLDLSLIKPRPNTKKLEGEIMTKGDHSLLYIMHKYPQLQHIQIDPRQNDNIHTFTSDVFGNFLSYIARMPYHRLDRYYTPLTIAADALKEYCKSLPNKELESLRIECSSDSHHNNYIPQAGITIVKDPIPPFEDTQKVCFEYNTMFINGRLSHMDVIETNGDLFKNLAFRLHDKSVKDLKDKENGIEEIGKGMYHMASGYCLDHIFEHCFSLEELYLYNARFIHCNPSISKSQSITTLVMGSITLSTNILPELSIRLPCLKYLKMANYTFVDVKGYDMYHRHTTIDTVNTSFNCLCLEGSFTNRIFFSITSKTICFKVSELVGDKYFKHNEAGQRKKYSKSDMDECETSYYDREGPTLWIRVKSVSELDLDRFTG